jgi:hypothetical protein
MRATSKDISLKLRKPMRNSLFRWGQPKISLKDSQGS